MTALTTTDRPATRAPLSPWARWLLALFLPVGVGLPAATYLFALAAGAR